MKRFLLITILFSIFLQLNAQSIQLKNTVIDHENNPLPFAYVIGKSTNIATVTNADGEFSFYLSTDQLDSIFVFSYLGFSPLQITGYDIQKAQNGIQLKPSAVALDMVEIRPTKMETPKSLLKKIQKNLERNYPTDLYRLNGYYREALREKDEFIRYADAAVEVELHPYQSKKYKWRDYYKANSNDITSLSNISGSGCERLHRYHFHTRSLVNDKAKIINSRASIDNGKEDVTANIEAGPIGLMVKDELKYKTTFLDKKKYEHYDYSIHEINVPKHGWVFQLKFKTNLDTAVIGAYQRQALSKNRNRKALMKAMKQIRGKKSLEGEIWVNRDDFAIVHLEYRVPKNHKAFLCTCGPMTINHFDFQVAIDYEKKADKYIPTYFQHQDEFIYKDTNRNELIPYLANSEFYLTGYELNTKSNIKSTELFANLDANQLFDYPLEYDREFWENYHQKYPWSKVPDSVFESISKDTSLEAQFTLKNLRDTSLKPPIAKKKAHITQIHDYTLVDNYAWLKQVKNPKANREIIDYLKAENKYTDNYFVPLKKSQRHLYKELLSRIDQTYESLPNRIEHYYYSVQYLEDKEYPLYRRKKEGEKEWTIILDVNQLAEGKDYYAISGLSVNPTQDVCALFINTDGSDKAILKFRNIEEQVFLEDSLENAGSVIWLNDSSFLYAVQDKKTNRTYQIKHHQLYDSQDNDKVVFEEKDSRFSIGLGKSRSKKYIYLGSNSKTSNEIYFMPTDSDSLTFQLITPRENDVFYSVTDDSNQFYIVSNKFRQNYDIRTARIGSSEHSEWKAFYTPRKESILENYLILENHIVLIESEMMENKMLLMDRADQSIEKVKFKSDYFSIGLTNNDVKMQDSVTYSYATMKEPAKVYRMSLETKETRLLKVDTVKYLPNERWITQDLVFVEAEDGTKIPMTLLYWKYQKNNKTKFRKTYMMAYGSYGSDNSPSFNSTLFSLVNRGFIVAIPHVRGGGELGKKWHDGGKMMNKKNTFTDFIACTEYLIEKGFAKKGNIVAQGGSAGGLLMGAIANMRPDLYHTIILDVPFVDVINTMLDDKLPLTTIEYLEWGNPNYKPHFDYIKSYSPYDNVKAQDYPNLLFFTGLNDNRVGYWEPAKMVAKLRSMKTDQNLILLKTNMNAGHGGGSGRFSGLEELAYKYALIFDLLSQDFTEMLDEEEE